MRRFLNRSTILSLLAVAAVLALSFVAERRLDAFLIRLLNMWGIYIIMVTSFDLVYGASGQFSLAHAGLAAIGAYTVSLLTLPADAKQMSFLLAPPIPFIAEIRWPFLPALILGGLLAALIGFLIGSPALRLHGDYLLIVTFGFSEIIRLVLINLPMITNGAMGLKGVPYLSSLPWTTLAVIVTLFVIGRLINSSYGRALKCVREDEIAAEAVGVNLYRHKTLAFVVSSFFVGIAGGLFAEILGTVDPNTFRPALTYAIVTMAILGGIRSLSGGATAAGIYTAMSEILRSVEAPRLIFGYDFPGLPGLRQLIFALMLLLLILFARRGLMGSREFSWDWIFSWFKPRKSKTDRQAT
jgi:branched-chain amino acid transport system permease protein